MYQVIFTTKHGERVVDEHRFHDREEANTFAGIEMLQMEGVDVESFDTAEVLDSE